MNLKNKNKMIKKIEEMHYKFDVHTSVSRLNNADLYEYLKFRGEMMSEEVQEYFEALKDRDAEGVVDALIDNLVFTLGTLDILHVDIEEAFNAVIDANLNKEIGVKEGRPNPFGFPDMIKPEGWEEPSHKGNIGLLSLLENHTPNEDDSEVGSIKVLDECRELQINKSNDYQNPNSSIKQADYYPNGITTIHDIVQAKMLRIKSVMEAMQNDSNYEQNFESLEDSAKDAINYLSFFVAYCRGKIKGQNQEDGVFK